MRPSAYDETLAKDTVVEDRDQVKVTFAGGNVFHIEAEGSDVKEIRRGADAAWTRAENLRKELNPEYVSPLAAKSDESTGGDKGPVPATKPEVAPATPPKADAKGPDKPAPEAAKPAAEKPYRVGSVVGVLRMVAVDLVMDMLGGDAGRVALLQGSDEARRLSRRVRATDGRCAPIFFTKVDISDKNEEPALFDGLYTLACAMNLGLERIAVVLLPSGEVGAIQASIAGLMRASLSNDTDDGDEMFFKANN